MTEARQPRICVCTPTRDEISWQTQHALRENMDGFDFEHFIVRGKPVVEARNELAAMATEWAAEDRDAAIVWCDDDAWWPRGTIARLVPQLHPGPRLVTGFICWRDEYMKAFASFDWREPQTSGPLAGLLSRMWEACRSGAPLSRDEIDAECGRIQNDVTLPDPRTADSDMIEIGSINGTFFIITKSVLDRVGPCPFNAAYAEDTAFALRCVLAEVPMFADPAVHIGHVDRRNGAMYFPWKRAMELRDGAIMPFSGERLRYDRRTYGFRSDPLADAQKRLRELLGLTVYY